MKYKIVEPEYINIQNQYQMNSLLAKIVASHNYSQNEIHSMMNPRLVFHQFSLFEEADITLERIEEAIENEEKICIYGDYDCDGILATVILVQAFLERGVNVGYHIPNRFVDGYGLNKERVKQMAEKGYTLIITVDNGVKAFDAIECANELGVDVIVTDHHQFDNDLPDACSFIHTKLSPDYPFKEISGGFVAYKLASALLNKQDKYLYCLAAITTISDMMPLLDENRSLVKRALTFMQEEKYLPLELLLGNQQKYTSTAIGFTIAPKINSFGRLPELCNPNILVKYFLKNAPKELLMKVSQVANDINLKRQEMTNEQFEHIEIKDDPFMYYASSTVHEGLIGLIAGKYTHKYEKPSFVMHYDEESGIYRGSARSVEGVPLHQLFEKFSSELLIYGGHAMAGGFSLNKDHFDSFYECLKEELKDIHCETQEDVILINEHDLSIQNIESLNLLEPFGMNNEEPLFILKNVPVSNYILMKEGKHLKLELNYPSVKLFGLYFNQGTIVHELKQKISIDLIGTLSINEFRNQKTINFIIKDVL